MLCLYYAWYFCYLGMGDKKGRTLSQSASYLNPCKRHLIATHILTSENKEILDLHIDWGVCVGGDARRHSDLAVRGEVALPPPEALSTLWPVVASPRHFSNKNKEKRIMGTHDLAAVARSLVSFFFSCLPVLPCLCLS